MKSILAVLGLLLPLGLAAQTSWTGASSTAWGNAANWTAGVPTASVDAIIGDGNFTGSNQPLVNVNATCKSLLIGNGTKACTLTVSKRKVTCSGSITIGTNGTVAHTGAIVISLAGNWTNYGSYSANNNGATVTFAGTAQVLAGNSGTTFRQLTVNAGSTATLKTDILVTRTLTVSGTLDPDDAPTRLISGVGGLTVNSGGKLLVRAATFDANYGLTGTKTLNAASTVEYAATNIDQIVSSGLTYGTLRISGGTKKTLAANLPPLNASKSTRGNIYVDSGTFDLSTFAANRGTPAGGTLSVTNGATLRLAGTFPANFNTRSLAASSLVEYYGGNQSINAATYGNLVLSAASGSAAKTFPASALTIAGNLIASNAPAANLSVTSAGALTINGNVFLGTGARFDAGAFSHSISGNWTNHGTLVASNSTILFKGAGALITGNGTNNFNNLTISGTGVAASSNTTLTVAGNLNTTGSGSFTHTPGGSGRITLSGSGRSVSGALAFSDLFVTGSITGSNSVTVAGDLNVAGAFSISTGTLTLSGSGTTITGDGAISLAGLSVSGTVISSSSISISSNLTVSGSFAADSGLVRFTGNSSLSGSANLFDVALNGSRLQLGAGSVLGIARNFNITSGVFDVTTSVPNTVNYNGAAPQTVCATNYHNLMLSGGGMKQAGGAVAVAGNLAIASGTLFDAGSFNHTIYGNWINNGLFGAGDGSIQWLGAQNSYVTGSNTFNTLDVAKSSGSVVVLSNDVAAANVNVSSGRILTDTNTLTVTSSRTGSGTILGTIRRLHPFVQNVSYAFEGPDNTITFPSLTEISSITVSVSVAPVGGFAAGGSINRQYSVDLVATGAYSARLRLHYEDAELNGNDEANMFLWRDTGAGWVPDSKSSNDTANNWVELGSIADLRGRWTFSDTLNIARWNGSVSADWSDPANWTAVEGNPTLPPSTNEIVELGTGGWTYPPSINSLVKIKALGFGPAKSTPLNINVGGSLAVDGNVGLAGTWTENAAHSIVVGDQTLSIGGDLVLSDGTNGHSIDLTIGNGSVSVADSLTQSGGANVSFTGTGVLSIGGSFNYMSGTFNAGLGTVCYNGTSAQTAAGGISYHNLRVNKGSGAATLSSAAAIAGDLVVTNAGVLVVDAPVTVAGSVVVESGSTLDGGSALIAVGNNWLNRGAFVPSTGSVIFNGSGLQTIDSAVFNNLTINKPTGSAQLSGNLTLNGDLTVAAGILDLGGFAIARGSAGGMLTLAAGTTLQVGGGFPSNFGTRNLSSGSLVRYSGTTMQDVSGEAYGSLILENGGSNAKTLGAAASVAGDLLISSNATFDAGSAALTVSGNWLNLGTFIPATSSVSLDGAAKALSGTNGFHDLAVSGSYTCSGDLAVSGTMNVSGNLTAGATCAFSGDFLNTGTFSSSGSVEFFGDSIQAIVLDSGFSSSGTVTFSGSVAPSLSAASTPVLHDVVIRNSGGVSPASSWIVGGSFLVDSGARFDGGAANQTFNGDFTNNGSLASSGILTFNPSHAVTLVLRGNSFTSSGTIVFGGASPVVVSSSGATFEDVVIANTAGVTPSSDWRVNGDFHIESGAVFIAGNGLVHTVKGDFSNNGNFNGSGSTVVFDTATFITGPGTTAFNNLTISGTVTNQAEIMVSGNFRNDGLFDSTGSAVRFVGSSPSVLSGTATPFNIDTLEVAKSGAPVVLAVDLAEVSDLLVASGTLDLSTFAIETSATAGTLEMDPGTTLKIGGASTLPVFSAYALDPASTIEYSGASSQTIAPFNYGSLASSSTGVRVLPSSGIIGIAGTFTPGGNSYSVTGSTVDFNGDSAQTIPAFNYFHLKSSAGGVRTLSGNIGIAGTFTPGPSAYTVTGSTINFNGGSQSVPAFTYNNLTMSGSSTKTLSGNITVNGTLALAAGTFADGGFTATVNGALANDVSHSGTGKILLTGAAVPHPLSGLGSYSNLELDDALGAILSTNITVNGVLTLTTGALATTTTNKVIIAASGAVTRTSGHVFGNLQKTIAPSASSRAFEVGDANRYAPLSVSFNNVSGNGTLVATTVAGDYPDLVGSGIVPSRNINRYWNLTNSGFAFANCSVTLNFNAADLDPTAYPTNFVVAKKGATNWTRMGVAARTATSIQVTNVASVGTFVVGEPGAAITTQPVSQRVNLGSNAVFSVSAAGSALTYQWRLAGTAISGATNSSYTIPSVQDSNAGTYSVIVDNGLSVISSNAVLTVNHPPTINAIADQTLAQGASLTLQLAAGDVDGGVLGYTLAVAPSGATISTNGLVQWTPTPAQTPSTNTFTVRVTDDGSLTATRSFLVTVVSGVVPVRPALGLQLGGGNILLTIAGNPGQIVWIQTSSNLVSWASIATNSIGTNGVVQFQEKSDKPSRFYRSVTP